MTVPMVGVFRTTSRYAKNPKINLKTNVIPKPALQQVRDLRFLSTILLS